MGTDGGWGNAQGGCACCARVCRCVRFVDVYKYVFMVGGTGRLRLLCEVLEMCMIMERGIKCETGKKERFGLCI